jgi:hypothetical protein
VEGRAVLYNKICLLINRISGKGSGDRRRRLMINEYILVLPTLFSFLIYG